MMQKVMELGIGRNENRRSNEKEPEQGEGEKGEREAAREIGWNEDADGQDYGIIDLIKKLEAKSPRHRQRCMTAELSVNLVSLTERDDIESYLAGSVPLVDLQAGT